MQRRDFLAASALLTGAALPRLGRAAEVAPCPPGTASVSGGGSVVAECVSSVGLPAWVASLSPWEWTRVSSIASNTFASVWPDKANNGLPAVSLPGVGKGGSPAGVIDAWGCIACTASGDVYLFGGGHSDYAGNEVYRLRLGAATPYYERLTNPTPDAQIAENVEYGGDGLPTSRHTGHSMWIENNKLFVLGGKGLWYNGQGDSTKLDIFDLGTRRWATNASPTFASLAKARSNACGDFNGNLYAATAGGNYEVIQINTATYTRTTLGNAGGNRGLYWAAAYDIAHRRIWSIGNPDGSPPATPPATYWQVGGGLVDPALTGAAAANFDQGGYNPGLCYDAANDSLLLKAPTGNTVFRMDCASFNCTVQATTYAGGTLRSAANEVNGRFRYVPQLRGCVYIPSSDEVYFLRTS